MRKGVKDIEQQKEVDCLLLLLFQHNHIFSAAIAIALLISIVFDATAMIIHNNVSVF